jgi:para-nitrobenzyl esterase
VFQFDWRTPIDGGKWGAHHGLDVAFVFDNVVNVPEKVGSVDGASELSGLMSAACIAFARARKPDIKGLPAWPVYDLQKRSTMVFDVTCRVEADPRGDERRLFSMVPYVQPGT